MRVKVSRAESPTRYDLLLDMHGAPGHMPMLQSVCNAVKQFFARNGVTLSKEVIDNADLIDTTLIPKVTRKRYDTEPENEALERAKKTLKDNESVYLVDDGLIFVTDLTNRVEELLIEPQCVVTKATYVDADLTKATRTNPYRWMLGE